MRHLAIAIPRMRRSLVIAALASALLGPTAVAQSPTAGLLAPGKRVRVDWAGKSMTGTLESITSDTIALLRGARPTLRLPLSGSRLQLSRGRESRWASARRWGLRSGIGFAALGLVVEALSPQAEDGNCGAAGPCGTAASRIATSAFTFALIGGGMGTFIPRERWVTVSIPLQK